MAAVMNLPRPMTSTGFPKMHLPVIQHPKARLDSSGNLSIRGQAGMGSRAGSRVGSRGSRSVLSLAPLDKVQDAEDGDGAGGMEEENLPPLGSTSLSAWPGPVEQHPSRAAGDRGKYRSPVGNGPKYTQNELEYVVAEKLMTDQHRIKHLFRSCDPTGQGIVSREAFHRILVSMVGYVSNEQFTTLLQRLGLNDKAYVKFSAFMACFKDNEEGTKKEWVSPVQRMSLNGCGSSHSMLDEVTARDRFVSGAYCLTLLKDKFKNKNSSILDYLPPGCLESGSMIVQPQVMDMVTQLGIKVTDTEQYKLWSRIDSDSAGAVYTQKFFRQLGLDEKGHPRPLSVSPRIIKRKYMPPRQHTTIIAKLTKSKEDKEEKKTEGEKTEEATEKTTEVAKTGRKVIRIGKRIQPKLDRISDCLFWRFEEAYNSLELGLQCFDFLGDGYISRIDLKRVLDEFKLPIAILELDIFLSRCGIRSLHGQILYKELLIKFWNRGESGMVHRIITNPNHAFSKGFSLPDDETLSSEQMEARLIEYMHGEFLKLLGWLQQCDKHKMGLITPHEFRDIIERLLGYRMTDKQYEELRQEAVPDAKDGLLHYAKFMEKFTVAPGSWNHKIHGGFRVQQVQKVLETPAVVHRLKNTAKEQADERERERREEKEDKKRKEKERIEEEEKRKEEEVKNSYGRSLEELNELVYDLVRRRFHLVDKVFKELDRRMTGRFSKPQFIDMLKQCGIILIVPEVNKLWQSFRLGPDNMFTFTTMMTHFQDMQDKMDGKLAPQDSSRDAPKTSARDSARDCVKTSAGDATPEKHESSETVPRKAGREGSTLHVVHEEDGTLTDEELIAKLKPKVLANWERITGLLRHLDRTGTTTVTGADMKDVLKVLEVCTSDQQTAQLNAKFDLKKDGRFHYMDFLRCYTESKGGNTGLTQRLETRASGKH